MSFTDQIRDLALSGFSGLWVETQEAATTLNDLIELARSEKWVLATWDFANRLRLLAGGDGVSPEARDAAHQEAGLSLDVSTPQAYANYIRAAGPVWAELHNVSDSEDPRGQRHRSIFVVSAWDDKPEIINNGPIQANLLDAIQRGQEGGTWTVLFLTTGAKTPATLQKQVTELSYPLPTRDEIVTLIDRNMPLALPVTEEERQPIISAFSGLTRTEITNIGSLALRRKGNYSTDVIWEMKSEQIKRTGCLQVFRSDESLAELGGLDHLKTFATELLTHPQTDPNLMPKGLLITGIPGCGKTQLAKVIGAATRRETVMFDVRGVQDSLVGNTEKKLRQVLSMVDSMAPCNLVIDEVEKALSGSSGSTSGVMTGVLGTLLSYLSDRRSDVFVMCTSNNVTSLPPEFARAERFDAMFFVDVPSTDDREQIWTIWLRNYHILDGDLDRLVDASANWTGAEIKSACRLSALRKKSIFEAMKSVVPVFRTAEESLRLTREWASGRCLSASAFEHYRLPPPTKKLKPLSLGDGKRKVQRST